MKLQRFMSHSPFRDLPGFFTAFTGITLPAVENANHTWFNFRNVADQEAEVAIYDYIGSWGVSANDFLSELNSLDVKNLTVRINSPGGEVSDGLAIYNALSRFDGVVTVFVDGMAASAASFIAQAASEGRLFMSPHSEMMIHDAQGVCMGPAADMRKMGEWLDIASDNIAGIYHGRAGGKLEDWRAAMRDETLYSDQSAVDAGLADGISSDGVEITSHAAPKIKAEVTPSEVTEEDFDYGKALRDAVPDEFDYAAALREAVASTAS